VVLYCLEDFQAVCYDWFLYLYVLFPLFMVLGDGGRVLYTLYKGSVHSWADPELVLMHVKNPGAFQKVRATVSEKFPKVGEVIENMETPSLDTTAKVFGIFGSLASVIGLYTRDTMSTTQENKTTESSQSIDVKELTNQVINLEREQKDLRMKQTDLENYLKTLEQAHWKPKTHENVLTQAVSKELHHPSSSPPALGDTEVDKTPLEIVKHNIPVLDPPVLPKEIYTKTALSKKEEVSLESSSDSKGSEETEPEPSEKVAGDVTGSETQAPSVCENISVLGHWILNWLLSEIFLERFCL
jgi:hypothetical protein